MSKKLTNQNVINKIIEDLSLENEPTREQEEAIVYLKASVAQLDLHDSKIDAETDSEEKEEVDTEE